MNNVWFGIIIEIAQGNVNRAWVLNTGTTQDCSCLHATVFSLRDGIAMRTQFPAQFCFPSTPHYHPTLECLPDFHTALSTLKKPSVRWHQIKSSYFRELGSAFSEIRALRLWAHNTQPPQGALIERYCFDIWENIIYEGRLVKNGSRWLISNLPIHLQP